MFTVPTEFYRNADNVIAMGPPADTGLRLIWYMCERIGISNLGGCDVLDFGCGARFAETISHREVPLKTYVGIDIYKEMLDFLQANVTDPRLSFFHMDTRNPFYNANGFPLTPDTVLPVGDRMFDVMCMFSVITHQLPEDAQAIFRILRRHIKEKGHMFFSARLEDGDFGYREYFAEAPTHLSVYTPALLRTLLEKSGWRILSVEPRNPGGLPIADSLLCAPA